MSLRPITLRGKEEIARKVNFKTPRVTIQTDNKRKSQWSSHSQKPATRDEPLKPSLIHCVRLIVDRSRRKVLTAESARVYFGSAMMKGSGTHPVKRPFARRASIKPRRKAEEAATGVVTQKGFSLA